MGLTTGDFESRRAESDEGAFYRWLGRVSADRHPRANRRQFSVLIDIGLDGTLLSWAQYEAGMRAFQKDVLPLMKQAGLR
jgi:hypothetical protein